MTIYFQGAVEPTKKLKKKHLKGNAFISFDFFFFGFCGAAPRHLFDNLNAFTFVQFWIGISD